MLVRLFIDNKSTHFPFPLVVLVQLRNLNLESDASKITVSTSQSFVQEQDKRMPIMQAAHRSWINLCFALLAKFVLASYQCVIILLKPCTRENMTSVDDSYANPGAELPLGISSPATQGIAPLVLYLLCFLQNMGLNFRFLKASLNSKMADLFLPPLSALHSPTLSRPRATDEDLN